MYRGAPREPFIRCCCGGRVEKRPRWIRSSAPKSTAFARMRPICLPVSLAKSRLRVPAKGLGNRAPGYPGCHQGHATNPGPRPWTGIDRLLVFLAKVREIHYRKGLYASGQRAQGRRPSHGHGIFVHPPACRYLSRQTFRRFDDRQGTVVNLRPGCAIETTLPVRPGDYLELHVMAPDQARPLNVGWPRFAGPTEQKPASNSSACAGTNRAGFNG